MTNNEIDKLINMIDTKDLKKVKEYLIKEKEKNTDKLLQKTFENYLSNNVFGYSYPNIPRYNLDYEDGQVITNGISIYYFNDKYFKITNNITKHKNYNRKSRYMENKEVKNYFELVNSYKKLVGMPFLIESSLGEDILTTSVVVDDSVKEYRFMESEYDTANILLNCPKFTLCKDGVMLYGESEKGKVYILGQKYI